jgi:hypothetical protein
MTMVWKLHGMEMTCHGMDWKGMKMAWKDMSMEFHGNGMPWHGLERHENDMEGHVNGMEWKWHGMNRFVGLGLGGSFVSLCSLTKTFGRNVK